jgi:isopentenyl-diphosphate delta-isomerase
VAHRDGLWHATIHVWVLDADGRVLLQQRSFSKAQFPGWWDISAAGHIGAHESGVREVSEELGADVTLDDLDFLGVYRVENTFGETVNHERSRVYLWRSGRPATSFMFRDGRSLALPASLRSSCDP